MSEPCPQCHDLGWVLDGDPSKAPLALELLACPLPDCGASGRDIEILSLNDAEFDSVARAPGPVGDPYEWRIVMSVSRAALPSVVDTP